MNSRTKKILIVSIITLVISVSACLVLAYQIDVQGKKLKEYVQLLTEQGAQEASYIRINRLVQETKQEREDITKAFFKDESESIGFLSDIESLAAAIGLELTTDELNKVTAEDKSEYIKMTFVYSGEKELVLKFTQLLEHIPYHSLVQNLRLQEVDNTTWEGTATIHITLASS